MFFSRQMHSRNFGRKMKPREIFGLFFSFCVVFLRPRIASAAACFVLISCGDERKKKEQARTREKQKKRNLLSFL